MNLWIGGYGPEQSAHGEGLRTFKELVEKGTDGNMAAASRLLGITKVAVLHAVRRHDLEEHTRQREG